MRLMSLSMRWWLALVFAAIVALTAFVVAQVMTARSEQAFRARAEELAAGAAVTAARAISAAESPGDVRRVAAETAKSRRIALFLFTRDGVLLTATRSNGVPLSSIEVLDEALTAAAGRLRLVESENGGRRIVVALPLNAGRAEVLVAVAARPDLVAAGDIVRGQLGWTVAIAIGVGALAGTIIAFLITSRLRRIALAAADIEQGSFDEPLEPRFKDELGQLAATVDGMRLRLRDSFARLGAERDRLQSLLGQLQEGVVAVDADLRIAYVNPRAALLVGRRVLVEGEPLPELWPDLELRSFAAALLAPGAAVSTERVSAGPERTYLLTGIPLQPGARSALLVISDITAADRRERAEREFVANAAHELRTPLAAIASAVDVLQAGAKDDPATRDQFLAVIERQSARLGRLVRALLTLARAQTRSEALQLETLDVAGLLAEVAVEVGERDGVEIETHCAAGLRARAHRDLLAQAVANLAWNAVKHGGAGVVVLSAAEEPRGRIRIEVRDDGSGIPESVRERAFDRFYRAGDRDAEGFGLGLPIVREVVSALGGEVEIEPADGRGTKATIVVSAAGVGES